MGRYFLIELDEEDYDYIVNLRGLSQLDLTDVVADIQETIVGATIQVVDYEDERNPVE